jgi:uridine kinase
MIGDKIIIKPQHYKAAEKILRIILQKIKDSKSRYTISVAGESGSGKSETAQALAEKLLEHGVTSAIFQQDDYFIYPPKTNDKTRRVDIGWVGVSEVRLKELDDHLKLALKGANDVVKPLVIYQEDRITEETISLDEAKVVIAEGTYTTTLKNVHTRIFIDRTYQETKKSRLERAREKQDDFIEKVLRIEHQIISSHKRDADIIITPDFDVMEQGI